MPLGLCISKIDQKFSYKGEDIIFDRSLVYWMVSIMEAVINKFTHKITNKWRDLLVRGKYIWSHAGFQKYFRNTGWMFFGYFFNIISLSINLWIARYLGPTNFGIISYVFAFVGIFGFLTNLGLNEVIIKKVVQNPEKRDEILGTGFWLMVIGGFLSFTLITIFAYILEENFLIKSLIIVYATITILSPFQIIAAYFQANVQAKKNAIAQIIGTVISSIFKIIVILSGKGIIWLIFTFVFDYMVGSSLYIRNYIKSGLSFLKWKFNKNLAKEFLSVSYLLILAGMTGYLLMKFDQVMIKSFLDETAVGIYASAVRISELWYFIPNIVIASVFPAILNAQKTNFESYKNRLKKMFIFLFSIGLIISIVVSFLAPYIISLIFGEKYLEAVPILQIYTWSSIGLFLMLGINKYFLSQEKYKSIFIFSLIAVLLNILLNIIMIPTVGLTGAAWATLIAYSIGPVLILLLFKFKKL